MVNQKTIEVERLESGYLIELDGKRHGRLELGNVQDILKKVLNDAVFPFTDKEYKRMSVSLTVEIVVPKRPKG